MLCLWKRHLKKCPHKDIYYRRCTCPIWAMGTFQGQFIRKSLGTRSWERGTQIIREWEDSSNVEVVTLEQAAAKFIEDCKSRHLSVDTENKYKLLFKELTAYFSNREVQHIKLDDLSTFRASWNVSPITALKKLERMKSFFKFCEDRKWIKSNPARLLKTPKTSFAPTLPFTEEEWDKILWATEIYPIKGIYGEKSRQRIKTFVMTLRYTGLRIRDVVRLKREHVQDWKVQLYTQKTGQAVYIPIPAKLERMLAEIPTNGYFFWSGLGNEKSCVGDWQRSLRKLFKLAGVQGHAHMFRDTMAVDLLNKGIPLETVAVILGNSLKVCEKHYAPWVKSRQTALEESIKKTWM